MAKIITHEYLLRVLNYDPHDGSFSWRIDIPKKIRAGMPAGSVTNGKRVVAVGGRNYQAHRLAWFYCSGAEPSGYIVPINGNFLDCRLENLRVVTPQAAMARGGARSTSSSGVKGVSWNTRRRKWVASLTVNYRQVNLGSFDTIEQAKNAYDMASRDSVRICDPETLNEKRNQTRILSRQRRLWTNLCRDWDMVGWPSFAEFAVDVGSPPVDGSLVAPVDASMPIGPGNFTWVKRAVHDKTTREGQRAMQRHYRSHNLERYRMSGLRRNYGMDTDDYQRMHDSQKGLCAICGEPEDHTRGGFVLNLAVDHCHKTGAVRGLLCGHCNKGIGNFKDDLDRLRKAIAYLEHHAQS